MKRRNIIIVIILAITAFNISALATIFYYNRQAAVKQDSPFQLPDSHYARWFEDELNLDNDQFEVFRNANRNYHHSGQEILDEMQMIRIDILNELDKKTPDRKLLANYADQIGKLHTELKNLTIQYYLQMKEACNESQKEKLHAIFKSMLDEEGNAGIPDNSSK